MKTETIDYKQTLEDHYKEELEIQDYPYTKHHFLSEHVFNFITYDSDIDKMFSIRMLDVINAILKKETFDYIEKSQANYENYLTMVNMSFLFRTLEWGGSIRGAWFDKFPNSSMYVNEKIEVPKGDMERFMYELIEWMEA